MLNPKCLMTKTILMNAASKWAMEKKNMNQALLWQPSWIALTSLCKMNIPNAWMTAMGATPSSAQKALSFTLWSGYIPTS